MIEIYGAGPSRWAKCYWMLKELGVEFKEHVIDFSKGEQHSPKYLEMNPFGKMPVMKDGSFTLFESSAILNYLGEKYPESGLVPKSGTTDRAMYDQWMSVSVTELEQPLWRIARHTFIYPESVRSQQDIKLAKEDFGKLATVLEGCLAGKKFIVGNRFTAADISLAYTLGWAQGLALVSPHKNCSRYLGEMTSRPAFPAHLFKQ